MHHRRLFAPAVLALALLAACGDDNSVGSGLNELTIGEAANQGFDTTTTAPPDTAVDAGQAAIGKEPSTTLTTAPPATPPPTAAPTTERKIEYFEIAVLGDQQGASQFDPPVAVVPAGVQIRWTNKDSVARSVEADNGEFSSGMLQPGQTFVWTATGSGRINYSDGTRPYAVGAVEVQ